jgi:hypothetical protein
VGVSGLYGLGYTVFAKLNPALRAGVGQCSTEEIRDGIAARQYDAVLYTSIWRCNDYLADVLQRYRRSEIIALDGEDLTSVANVAVRTTYFKRELIEPYTKTCLPIAFAYPSYFSPPLDWREPDRTQLLAPCVPGYTKSYVFKTEEAYFRQYSKSIFALTVKKAGWDCMRHYEILKAGSIPFFPDIIEKPNETMSEYPIGLQTEANCLLLSILAKPSLAVRFVDKMARISGGFDLWLSNSGHTNVYHRLLKS